LDSFFDKCVSEEEDTEVQKISWGEESSIAVHDMQILARPSSASEEVSSQHEDIALLVMADDEQQTWLQVKDLGAIMTRNVPNTMTSRTSRNPSANAIQFMSIDEAVRIPGMPVAGVALVSQQRASAEDNVPVDVTESRPIASEFVHRCSRRQKLRKDQAEVCPICLDRMTKSQHVITLPCFHRLHDGCSERYFGTVGVKPMCPVCRFDMAAM
jgi:hypothetical protein